MKNIYRLFFVMFILFSISTQLKAQWIQTCGEYPNGAVCFALYGTDLFLGADDGGYHSTNKGTTWFAVSPTNKNYPGISAFAILDTNLFAASPFGVYRSANKGISWNKTNNSITGNDSHLAVLDKHLFAGGQDGLVFHSTDNGANWSSIAIGLTNNDLRSLSFFPDGTGGSNLFAVTKNYRHALTSGSDYSGVYLSTNYGTNWTEINTSGLPSRIFYGFTASGANFYLGVDGYGAYRSTNNGINWTAINSGLPGRNVTDFAFSGANLFAAAGDLYLSTNNGTSWSPVKIPGSVTSISVVGTTLYAYGDMGFYFSTNNGISWTTNLSNTQIYTLTVSGKNLFAGAGFNESNDGLGGIFLSTNNGTDWTTISNSLPSTNVRAIAVSDNKLFVGTADYGYWTDGPKRGGVFLSSNNGASWAEASTGLTSTDVRSLIVYSDGTGGTNLLAGTDFGLFKSTNNGSNWSEVKDGLPSGNIAYPRRPHVYFLAASGANLFAGIYPDEYAGGGGVWLSTNNGTSWTEVNTGLKDKNMTALTASGNNIYVGTYQGVFKSTNNGTNWSEMNTGLTTLYVNALTLYGNNLFALANESVFLYPGNGSSWSFVGSLAGWAQTLAACGANLFAGTWKRPLSEMVTGIESVKTELPAHFSLEQNYPNPFNPTTIIKFGLQQRAMTKLCIFDVLGREVKTVVDGELEAGYHEISFDASRLTSGTYFYRIQAGNFSSTKKMTLVK